MTAASREGENLAMACRGYRPLSEAGAGRLAV